MLPYYTTQLVIIIQLNRFQLTFLLLVFFVVIVLFSTVVSKGTEAPIKNVRNDGDDDDDDEEEKGGASSLT